MRQYNFTFYNVEPETDEVLGYVEKTVWADNRMEAWMAAAEWATNNGYNDFEDDRCPEDRWYDTLKGEF